MANFGTPFAGLASSKKLSKNELVRAIRFSIAAEYEAIQLYTQLADSIEDKIAIKVLMDVAKEEKVHAGEFLRLLKEIDSEEFVHYQEGTKEVEAMLKSLT